MQVIVNRSKSHHLNANSFEARLAPFIIFLKTKEKLRHLQFDESRESRESREIREFRNPDDYGKTFSGI